MCRRDLGGLSLHTPVAMAIRGGPAARSVRYGQSQFAELVFNSWPAGADAHLETTLNEHR